MKRYFGVVFAIGFVIAGIVFAYKKYDTKTTEAARDLNVERIRADFLDRVGWIRVNPDEKTYKDEVTTFLRWYFKEVNEHQNKYGGNKNFDDYLTELNERGAKSKKDERLDDKKVTYEYVRKIFDQLKSGSYSPMATFTNNGIRMDILSTNRVMDGADEKVRYQLVIWGIPRELRIDDRGTKKVVANASFTIGWKLFDEKGKLLGEMNASGDPASRIDWPERYVKFFPPGIMIGHYDVDLMPSEFPPEKDAKKKDPIPLKAVEIAFNINSRTPSGGNINAAYTWKLDVPMEWKLRAGQEWKGAQESIRPEEEIDPAKREKANR
jgi:hypothetical protein